MKNKISLEWLLHSNAQVPQKFLKTKRRVNSLLIETNPCHALEMTTKMQFKSSIVLFQEEEQIHSWPSKAARRSINQCELGLCSSSAWAQLLATLIVYGSHFFALPISVGKQIFINCMRICIPLSLLVPLWLSSGIKVIDIKAGCLPI